MASLASLQGTNGGASQPRSAIPWINSRLADQASPAAIQPFPEPDPTAGVPAAATAATEPLDQQLRDAIIGVAELPSIAAGSYGEEVWSVSLTDDVRQVLTAAAPTGWNAADRLLRELLLAPPSPAIADHLAAGRIAALLRIGAVTEAYSVARMLPVP